MLQRRELERTALERAGVAAFVLSSGDASGQENADSLVAALPAVVKAARDLQPPFIARIQRGGRLHLPQGRSDGQRAGRASDGGRGARTFPVGPV
jgi:hypothetical protein